MKINNIINNIHIIYPPLYIYIYNQASTNRGCKAISSSGGCHAIVLKVS